MALRTAFTAFFSLRHTIARAPMGDASGGALAAGVSHGGGLGLTPRPGWPDQAEYGRIAPHHGGQPVTRTSVAPGRDGAGPA